MKEKSFQLMCKRKYTCVYPNNRKLADVKIEMNSTAYISIKIIIG